MTNLNTTAEWLAWLPFIVYYSSTFPQILLNYRSHSTAGLSYRMLFFDYTGATSTTIYTFLLWLPFACRVMEPLCWLNITTLVLQSFYYCHDSSFRRSLIYSFLVLNLFCVASLIIGWWYPVEIGNMMGWISVVVQFFTQLPQVVKNHRRKSVKGLSFAYVTMLGCAGLLEMVIAMILHLPIQNMLNGLRALGYYVVLCVQFYRYHGFALSKENGSC